MLGMLLGFVTRPHAVGPAGIRFRCGAEVDVATRKRQLLAEAADRWLTARTIENLTVTLGFERVKDSTVESWGSRGQIARQRIPSPTRSGEGPWHFLLGDVLTRLEAARVRRSA